MKRSKFFIYLIPLVMLASGCRKDQWNDCFEDTGKDETVTRTLEHFTKLKIGEKFEVILTQDTTQNEEVKITGGKNIIGQIVTEVKNNTLTITNKNTCNFVRSYDRKITIEIRVKYLDDIEIYSATNLSCPNTLRFDDKSITIKNFGLGNINLKINAGILNVQTINSGNVFLEGFANIVSCSIDEATQLDARNLVCDDMYIVSFTPLDCFVNAQKQLVVSIFYKGNVNYVPHPGLNIKFEIQKGTGNLLPM